MTIEACRAGIPGQVLHVVVIVTSKTCRVQVIHVEYDINMSTKFTDIYHVERLLHPFHGDHVNLLCETLRLHI